MSSQIKIINPIGIFDRTKAPDFQQEIDQLLREGIKVILIDFKRVTFMDSSGLGALVLALKKIQSSGGKLFLMSLNEQVQMLFDLTNLNSQFEFVDSEIELKIKLENEE